MAVLGVLGHARFAGYTAANGTAFAAAWMYRLALGWAIWEATHSGLWLGLLAICDLGPALIFGPLGGVWGDRAGPANVIVRAQSLVILSMLLVGFAIWVGAPPYLLLLLSLLSGSAVTSEDAARAVIATELVPEDDKGAAVAMTAVVINLARFTGPALAGVLAAWGGLVWIFPIAAVLGVPLALFAAFSRVPHHRAGTDRSLLGELADALAYARRDRLIGLILISFLLSCLLVRPIYELVPALVGRIYDKDIVGLSIMTTAIGLGAMVAGAVMLRKRDARQAGQVHFIGALTGGALMPMLALTPGFAGAVLLCAGLGFAIALCAIAAQIVVQLGSDAALRNRMLALWSIILRFGPAIGALAIGALGDALGFRAPLIAVGLLAILCAAGLLFVFRRRLVRAD